MAYAPGDELSVYSIEIVAPFREHGRMVEGRRMR